MKYQYFELMRGGAKAWEALDISDSILVDEGMMTAIDRVHLSTALEEILTRLGCALAMSRDSSPSSTQTELLLIPINMFFKVHRADPTGSD